MGVMPDDGSWFGGSILILDDIFDALGSFQTLLDAGFELAAATT